MVADSAEMVLRAKQHSQIATAYERAAADESLPPQPRAAFARKANWFRMLARIGAKKEEALAASKEKRRNRFRGSVTVS